MTVCRRCFVAATGALLLAPALARSEHRVVVGSGVASKQHRDTPPFTSIALGAAFSVELRRGSREGIEIVADDNLLPLIETKISSRADRTLTIDVAREARIEPRTPVVVVVDFVNLDALALGSSGTITGTGLHLEHLAVAVGGSGQMRLPALEVATLDVSIGGSGRLTADGHARQLSVSVAGSGRCDLERLVAGAVSVAVVGSGTVLVNAATSLSATIAGSGEVHYRGDATPTLTVVGNGRLKRL